MVKDFVVVAGAAGTLGQLITRAALARGATVKALVRPNTQASRTKEITDAGASVVSIDLSNVAALTKELQGARTVVSALQGLKDVMHSAQGNLLQASTAANVPRFIPSDFSLDFTKTLEGSNRNLDLRRDFHSQLNQSGIVWTSILNGGFMDLLAGDSPMVNHRSRQVTYVGQPDQEIDFTTMQNVASYTAAVALDPNETPKFLRIAGAVTSAQGIADAQTTVTGQIYRPRWMGSIGTTKFLIWILKLFGGQNSVFPAWQGMQYMENMMSGDGKLAPLDNDRYPEVKWTTLEEFFVENNPKQ